MNKKSFLFLILFSLSTTAMSDTLKQMLMYHPILGNHIITYTEVNGYAVTEDDIILRPLQQENRLKASLLTIEARRWNAGIIPYEIDPHLPAENVDSVLAAIKLWENTTHVHFVLLTPENRAQYPDYVSFIPEGGKICASYVGRFGGRQVVQLSPRCNTMITAHELGHVLGLWHEQSRIDRDNYIKILWENIDDRSKYNFEQHLTDGFDYGPYNYQSIMHYAPYAFSKNGQKTIIPLKDGVNIGQRDEINYLDVAAVNAMYPPHE